jgi:hypothetical protein
VIYPVTDSSSGKRFRVMLTINDSLGAPVSPECLTRLAAMQWHHQESSHAYNPA